MEEWRARNRCEWKRKSMQICSFIFNHVCHFEKGSIRTTVSFYRILHFVPSRSDEDRSTRSSVIRFEPECLFTCLVGVYLIDHSLRWPMARPASFFWLSSSSCRIRTRLGVSCGFHPLMRNLLFFFSNRDHRSSHSCRLAFLGMKWSRVISLTILLSIMGEETRTSMETIDEKKEREGETISWRVLLVRSSMEV